ncbi:MAG: adenylate/guanylate cyclase family protein [Deltaproteobacteria bacterium]|nr:adenylate/guanylate cyclase family protein [Deltaproteobacteria bacterium]
MKCPKCQVENPEGKNFCGECGTKLEILCPHCHSPSAPQFKFCGDCGHSLTLPSEPARKILSPDEKIAKIQKYLPRGITEKILSQRDKIEGERKQVTVMFCDMKGFTPLAERLSPEEVYGIMDQVYEILIQKVHDYEGTVNEMTGDGIMALFGAPIALEDAPQRAIRSAMAIHREMTRFNERVKQEKGDIPSLKMRIGIHTGPVVVGTLGNDLRVEFKAVGDTVNLSARMEQISEPGTTYVSGDTFNLTEGLFRFEALGEKEIKGKETPVAVYQVIAPSTRRTRFDVSAERGLTSLVGRERELELLLDGLERSKEGRGQAISIISEAGIGKSRLLYEFRKAVTNEYVTFLEGRCLSYSRNVAYHPVADALKANFEIQDNDTDKEIREKVVTGLKILKVDEASTLPYLLELLSVKDSGIDKILMSPEARKDRTQEALKRIVLKGSEIRPLVMAIEDLHWMDRSSEDALRQLLESISGSRVFLVFTYRPEFIHTWGSRSYHSQITLNRLSNRESLAMATHMLGTPNIEGRLEDMILQKTEGIPFFIEEFIKSLKDLKAIEKKDQVYLLTKNFQKLTIPSTIQDVIMARVDNLPEGAREVLRTGSVIEREFSYDLIKSVTGLSEQELLTHLSSLKDAELLYERGIFPQSTYIFKHSLTREVVYDSILTKKKKQLHAIIASNIEEAYKEDLCYHYGILANHCIASENHQKGAEYANLEAKRYQKAALFKDAIAYARMAVDSLERLPQTEANRKKLIHARTTLAIYNLSLNYLVEAKDAVEPVMDMVLEMKYRKSLPGIYFTMGTYCFGVEEDFSKGSRYMGEAIQISEEVGDALSLWMASSQLGIFLPHICEFEKASTYCNRCQELSKLANNPMGLALSKAYLTYMYTLRGQISLACQSCQEMLPSVEKYGDPYVKGTLYSHYGAALYYKGLFEEAEIYLTEGLKFCNKTFQVGWESVAAARLGFMSFDLGLYRKAQDYHLQAIRILERVKIHPSWENVQKTCLAKTRVRSNDRDINLAELFDYYGNNKMKSYEGFMASSIGEVMLYLDDDHMSDAEVWIQKAIDANTKNGTHWQLARDHALYADWFNKKGDAYRAKEHLTKAIDIFKECGADGWVTRTEKTLAVLT